MKCPSCSYACSDLRDICPQCYLDLRTHKKGLGLTILSPQATYEELLEKLHPKESRRSRLLDEILPMVNQLFGTIDSHPSRSSPPQSSPSASAPRVISPPQMPTAQNVEQISIIRDALASALNEPPAQEPPVEPSPSHAPQQAAHSPEPVSTPEATPPILEPTEPIPHDSIELLFTAALESVWDGRSGEIELGFEQLFQSYDHNQIAVLFELANQAIANPELEKSFQTAPPKSDARIVESKELRTVLKQTERAVAAQERAAREFQKHDANRGEVFIPSRTRKLAAFIVDTISGAFFALLVALGVAFLWVNADPYALVNLPIDEAIFFAKLATVFVALSLSVYPLIVGIFGLRTIGQRLLQLHIVDIEGDPAPSSALALRAVTLPISTVCLGFLPLIFARRPLHDVVAQTVVLGQANP